MATLNCRFSGNKISASITNNDGKNGTYSFSCVYNTDGGGTNTLSGSATVNDGATVSVGENTLTQKVIGLKSSSLKPL